MKKLTIILVFVLSFAALSAQAVTEGADVPSTHIITDHKGIEVEVPVDIQRIAVTGIYPLPSVLTVFFNSAEKIVSMNTPSLSAAKAGLLGKLYPEILNVSDKPVGTGEINVEELLNAKPDVVFYSTLGQGEAIRAAGIPAVCLSVDKWDYNVIETLDNWLSLLADMFPQDAAKAQKVHERSMQSYDLVQQRVKDIPQQERARLFFLFQYSATAMQTSGKHFWGQWWAQAVGAVNVAQDIDVNAGAPVNLEQVYAWNPDAILITNFTQVQPAGLLSGKVFEDDWSGIKAVKDGRVYKMPLGMYRSFLPGVDTPITLLWLAKTVYPTRFEDIDITSFAKEYYSDVFGVELTEEQIESIFAPPSSAAQGI